jgi:hypothetical protein
MIGTLCLSIDPWPSVHSDQPRYRVRQIKKMEERIMARHVKPTALSASASATTSDDMRQQDTALSACYRAEARGFAAGGELGNWLEIEREIAAHDQHE